MSIIISKGGENARRLERTVIDQEEYLQQYIHRNPDTLPFDELKDDLRLLILAREFDTASGPIDALGVDADGEIYIIEAKLDKNADRRRIIAQALDYGAALWAHSEQLIAAMQRSDWRVRLTEFLGGDEETVAAHLARIQENAKNGRFWFVVLMDRLDDRLRELISFINANSRFKVLGVELNFYRDGDLEIVIPNLYGADRAAEVVASAAPSSASGRWDAASFMQTAEAQLPPEAVDQLRRLITWCEDKGADSGWGAKGPKGGFNPKFPQVDPTRSVFSLNAAGLIYLNFKYLAVRDDAGAKFAKRFAENLSKANFVALPPDYLNKFPPMKLNQWGPRVEEFVQILDRSLPQ